MCTLLMMAAMGWCQQSDGQSGGGDAAAGGQSGGGFEMNGGGGSGSSGPTDQNGGSPGVSLSDLGFQPSFTYLFRARYNPHVGGYDIRFTGDALLAYYTGSTSAYNGPPHTSFPAGSAIDGRMNVSLYQVSADFGLARNIFNNIHFKVGPRLQWSIYNDLFTATATWGGGSADLAGAHSCSMYGVGLAGAIDVAHYTGNILPTIQFSVAVGGGKTMRYKEWELSVDLIRTSLDEYAYGRNVKAGANVGFMGKYFDQTSGSGSVPGPVPAAEENLHFTLFVPFARAFLIF
jgi:hypothetical protein